MQWFEMIRLRATGAGLAKVLPALEKQIKELNDSKKPVAASLYRHAWYDGDASVLLEWVGDEAGGKTREGHMLSELMRHFGSVDHGAWLRVDHSSDTAESLGLLSKRQRIQP